MLRRTLLMAALLLSMSLCRNAVAGELKLGDPAPMLKVSKFVKGSPVTKFEHGKMYVVEFWATWCGPCKTSIPHLTEMAKKYKDVQFIGVSVWEQTQSGVEPFVKEMGSKMDYAVCMDEVPAGKTGNEGFMAANWMTAAHQDGIPTAFVIDKESRVAWIGHPMTMDEPLGKIVKGDWDIKAEAAKFEKANAAKSKMAELNQSLSSAMQAKDYTKALSIVNGAIAETPELEQSLGAFKLSLLQKSGKPADAQAYMTRLIDEVYKDSAMGLNQLIWPIIDPDAKTKPSPADARMALKAALRADTLSESKDPAIADTLAAAYYATGNRAKAIETQQRVLKLAKGTELEKDPSLQAHLDLYKKAK